MPDEIPPTASTPEAVKTVAMPAHMPTPQIVSELMQHFSEMRAAHPGLHFALRPVVDEGQDQETHDPTSLLGVTVVIAKTLQAPQRTFDILVRGPHDDIHAIAEAVKAALEQRLGTKAP